MLYSLEDLSPKIHETAFVAPSAQIIGDVEILEGASVWFNCVLRGDAGKITIGWVVLPIIAALICLALLFILQNIFNQSVYF